MMYLLDFCSETIEIWRLVGKILNVFRIVIPLLVIIYGMIDLGKAVVASDDKEIKKAAKQLLIRIIAGICIFFVPTVVGFAFTLANNTDDGQLCRQCITSGC